MGYEEWLARVEEILGADAGGGLWTSQEAHEAGLRYQDAAQAVRDELTPDAWLALAGAQ